MYEIAFHLKMPVYMIEEEMPYEELLGWYDYFKRRPAGWQADDRAAKLLQVQGVKEKAYNLFPTLEAIYKPQQDDIKPGQISGASLKASVMFQKMMTAKGGDVVDL